jgi:hypothetical protein
MSTCLILFSTVIFGCQANTALISPNIGICQMEAMKTDRVSLARDNFIEVCMRSKGFRRVFKDGCFANVLSATCYEIDS